MKSRLQKLRRTSLDELRVRGSQALNAFAERHGMGAKLLTDKSFLKLFDESQFKHDLDSPTVLLEHFRNRSLRFFPAFADPAQTLRSLRVRWPGMESEIVERADRASAGLFDLLAFHDLSFGNPIDWQLEPTSGKRAPLIHWSRINYLDANQFGDKKIIWELNRHQHFVTLGQAYWITGDEKYAAVFSSQLTSWMDQNPPKLGVNWASSLEVAFRSISWLWAFHFFKNSGTLAPEVFARATQYLYLNARHLEKFLSTYFSPNTHLTGEALGLFYLGTVLPEFKESRRWRDTGLEILLSQLSRHVQEDGVYFEQSSYYHRYTTDFYLHVWLLLALNHEGQSDDLGTRLQLLLDHMMYITRPDGTTPFFGDDDGGRLLPLDFSRGNDFRSTLSTGAAIFERTDYKFVAGGLRAETLWLMGPAALDRIDRLPAVRPAVMSRAFRSGGYYVMRDGWTSDANYLLFDCGPHGTSNCGHAHADALSFELAVRGQTLLVDPGTYTYTGSKEMRDWFRGTAAHNTLTIDGESSSKPSGPFSWQTIAASSCSMWVAQDRFDYVSGTHDGYAGLASPVAVSRSILFLKTDYWVIRDQIETPGAHQIEARFHLESGLAPVLEHSGRVGVAAKTDWKGLEIATFAEGGGWSREDGWVSHCYGGKDAASVLVFKIDAPGTAELVTFLLPEALATGSEARVREIEALGGRAFQLNLPATQDFLLLKNKRDKAVETARLLSDFEVGWVRFEKGDDSPSELVLINGHKLEFEGRSLLKSSKLIKHLSARRVGDRFRIESDEGTLEIGLPVSDLDALFAGIGKL